MSFIDLYNGLHSELTQQGFPPSARVLIYTLAGEFNSARWIDSLVFSERDLIRLTGLKKTTLHEAKHFLTSRRLIDCKPYKNTTVYSLGDELKELLNRPAGDQLPTSNRPVGDQLPTSNRPVGDQLPTTFADCNIRMREDLDVKTLDVTAATATRACAPVNCDIDRLVDHWEQSGAFGKLNMLIVSKLNALLESYSCDEILTAMDKAALSNDNRHGVSYNYFEAILKGGDRNVRVARRPAASGATGLERRNVVELAQFARTDGKGAYDDDAPDCSWIYAGVSNVAESDV